METDAKGFVHVQNAYLQTVMYSLAFCCGRSYGVHEAAVQLSLENAILLTYTAQCGQGRHSTAQHQERSKLL